MKLNSFIVTALNKIKNTKLVKRGAAFVMAVVTLVTLSSCSKETKRNIQNGSSSIVADINNEYIGNEKTTNNAQLPSFYNCFNIFEDSEINRKYGVAYIEYADENVNFVDKLLNHKVSTEELSKAFDELNNDPTLAENFSFSNGNIEILEYDKSSILLKYKTKESYGYALVQLKGDKGYLVVFNQIELKSYSNSNCLKFYSNNDQKIITYNKLTGDLVILENTVCLGCDNDIISLARCDDKESIYHYDAKNGLSEKEKVNNLTIQKNYVSYNKDNMFNAVDLLNVQKYTKDLGKENFWIKLSDGSIVYVTKDGVQKRYQRYYRLQEGDFNKDYCVLSNLSTYPDGNDNYGHYFNSFYFNKNLDSIYELPYYNKMLDNNIVKGYIKYLQNDGSDCFVDLTTGKTYYIKDTVLSNEYTIYHALGASNNDSNCSIFKDGQGKTVLEVNGFYGYVQKYFDEEKIAIQSYWISDDKSVYYCPTIIDLSDFNNPKVILASNNFNLAETPINTIFKVYWRNENKYSLIDIRGNELSDKVDFIQFDTCDENDEIGYIATLSKFKENGEIEYTNISFDRDGKIIDEMSSKKLIKQK